MRDLLHAHGGKLELLREMYRAWPFWRTFIDNTQMVPLSSSIGRAGRTIFPTRLQPPAVKRFGRPTEFSVEGRIRFSDPRRESPSAAGRNVSAASNAGAHWRGVCEAKRSHR